jgi:hypothetical protein
MIDEGDCGEIGGMKIGRGNRSTRRKPAPAPFCPELYLNYATQQDASIHVKLKIY